MPDVATHGSDLCGGGSSFLGACRGTTGLRRVHRQGVEHAAVGPVARARKVALDVVAQEREALLREPLRSYGVVAEGGAERRGR